MNRDDLRRFFKRNGVRIALGLFILLGVMGVLIFEHQGRYPSKFLEHAFMALAISGFIGLIIELTLQREIAKNVFEAAIGYLLPDELKDELRWIYDQRLLCVSHVQAVNIKRILGTSLVSSHSTTTRTIKNISDEKFELRFGLGIDEWFYEDHPSRILSASFCLDGEVPSENIGLKAKRNAAGIDIGITPIIIPPGRSVTLNTEFEETYPENGMTFVTYAISTANPSVMIYAPDDIEVSAGFGSRQEHLITKRGDHTWQMDGVLLPHQDIRVRWWRKDQSEKWLPAVTRKP